MNAAARTDEKAGGGLLATAIVGLMLVPCFGVGLAVCAVVWWIAHGRLQRARDDGRPADPLVVSSRTVAAIGSIVGLIGLAFVFAARF